MFRISRISGEELAIALEEELVPDVRALKQHLHQLQDLPPRFRQRLLLHGQCLEDTATLHPAMELELIVLAFIPNPSPIEVQELTAAAGDGCLDKARALNEAKCHTPRSEQIMQRVGLDAWEVKICIPQFQVESLLKLPLDPDETDANGSSALRMAASSGHESVARLLLEAGANKDLATNDGSTALMLASENGHLEVVRLLLESGADKDLANVVGDTALMLASENGHLEVVRLLLESGADKDLADTDNGVTALMLASENGHLEVVRLLLESGADKNMAMNDGRTANMLASQEGQIEVVRLLLEPETTE